MKILQVHNYYRQPGGEDRVFEAESALLESRGHRLVRYTVHNDRIAAMSALAAARSTIWNPTVHRELRDLVRRERPQVVACQNTFPLISPSAYYAAREEGVPVVQTLHNYRFVCPGGILYRNGHVCEACLTRGVSWPGVLYGCYRASRLATGAVSTMLAVHGLLGTFADEVSLFVALTRFARDKFVEGGLPREKLVVKPHFVDPDPGPGDGRGGYALFAGRLTPEKGIETLLAAWERLGDLIPLRIAGDGPLAPTVAGAARRLPGVEWLGYCPPDRISALMGEAAFLVFPSQWYETFGRVIIEAFAAGTPVVASRIGGIPELVEHGRTGLLFRPGEHEDLAVQVQWAVAHPAALSGMRAEARREFETRYTAGRNYELLMDIYARAVGNA